LLTRLPIDRSCEQAGDKQGLGKDSRIGLPGDDRGHFFAAAEAMRRILVETARRKHARKHGGGLARRPLDEAELLAPEPREDLLALDEALTLLAATDRAAADLVQLRYFGDLTIPEAARVLGISPRSADRFWSYARAWLHQEVQGAGGGICPEIRGEISPHKSHYLLGTVPTGWFRPRI
jgi:hypothetical protein